MTHEISEVIILNGGQTINGKVLDKTFVLETKYGSLNLRQSDILMIKYKNPPHTLQDEVLIDEVTRLAGNLKPDVVSVSLAMNGETLKIPKEDIHSIVFYIGGRPTSNATLEALASKQGL